MKIQVRASDDRKMDAAVTLDQKESIFIFGRETPENKPRFLCIEDVPGKLTGIEIRAQQSSAEYVQDEEIKAAQEQANQTPPKRKGRKGGAL